MARRYFISSSREPEGPGRIRNRKPINRHVRRARVAVAKLWESADPELVAKIQALDPDGVRVYVNMLLTPEAIAPEYR